MSAKVMVTKTVAREGAFQRDIVAVKYSLKGDHAQRVRSLWIGLFVKGKGVTVMPEIRLRGPAAVLDVDTSCIEPGDGYKFGICEGDVWPLITVHALSQSFTLHPAMTEDEMRIALKELARERREEPALRVRPPQGRSSPLTVARNAAHAAAATAAFPSSPSSFTDSPQMARRREVDCVLAPFEMPETLVGLLKPTESLGADAFGVGDAVDALCDLDFAWHPGVIKACADGLFLVTFDEPLGWQQKLTPPDNMRLLRRAPQQPPPPPLTETSVRRTIAAHPKRGVSVPTNSSQHPDPELEENLPDAFWASMEEEQTRVRLSRSTQTQEELHEEERYLTLVEEDLREAFDAAAASPSLARLPSAVPVTSPVKPGSVASRTVSHRPPVRPTSRPTARPAPPPSSSRGASLRGAASPPPTSVGLGVAKVTRDFHAYRSGQMSVRKGDMLAVLSRPDNNWFMCGKNLDCGLVPARSVTFVPK